MGISSSSKVIISMIKKSFKIDLRYKSDSIAILLRPIIAILPIILYSIYSKNDYNMFFNNTGTYKYLNFLALSFFFMSFVNNVILSASLLITDELQQGTFESMMISTNNPLLLWGGEIIANILIQLIDSIFFYCIIMLIFNEKIYIAYPVTFIFTIFITSITSIGMGILLAGITIKTKLPKMAFMVTSLLCLLSGITYPVTIFPFWLKCISFLNPITFCMDLIRYSILGTSTYLNTSLEIIVVCIYSLLFLTIGILIYNNIIVTLKRKGTLSNY